MKQSENLEKDYPIQKIRQSKNPNVNTPVTIQERQKQRFGRRISVFPDLLRGLAWRFARLRSSEGVEQS